MSGTLFYSVAATAALSVCAASSAGIFENRPRVVAGGRDPVLAVRASGAISLLKVDKGDLWLQTSFDGGDSFEEAVRVNDKPGDVNSHGESSPQMQVRSRSEFYCMWSAQRGADGEPLLRFARSTNWGESFSKSIEVDPGAASQSFFTMNVSPKGVIYAAWLDGRERGRGRAGTSAVYLARSVNRGESFEQPLRVALDACPCCRPAIAFSGERAVYVGWRAVLEGNVRDIFVAGSADEGSTWGPPVRLAEDNWVLNGCPHSGAAMASIGKRLFVAWFAVRAKEPALSLAFSDDGGRTFSPRIPVSEGVLDPNHPVLQAAGDRLALVFQGRPAGRGEGWAPVDAYYREVDAEARLSGLQTLGHAMASVSYPVFASEEPGRLYVAWTEAGKDGKNVVLSRGRRTSVPAREVSHEAH